MATDLRLANKVVQKSKAYAAQLGCLGHIDYWTAIMVVAALLEDKELCQEVYNEAGWQKSDGELREEAIEKTLVDVLRDRADAAHSFAVTLGYDRSGHRGEFKDCQNGKCKVVHKLVQTAQDLPFFKTLGR